MPDAMGLSLTLTVGLAAIASASMVSAVSMNAVVAGGPVAIRLMPELRGADVDMAGTSIVWLSMTASDASWRCKRT